MKNSSQLNFTQHTLLFILKEKLYRIQIFTMNNNYFVMLQQNEGTQIYAFILKRCYIFGGKRLFLFSLINFLGLQMCQNKEIIQNKIWRGRDDIFYFPLYRRTQNETE